jgi:hypothetical protein
VWVGGWVEVDCEQRNHSLGMNMATLDKSGVL